MIKWVTHIYGAYGVNANAKAREDVSVVAEEVGYKPIIMFAHQFDGEEDSHYAPRVDGMTAGVSPGDLVVFQYPSLTGYNCDRRFVNQIKARGARVIALLQDAIVLRSSPNIGWLGNFSETDFFNQMDVVVAHSPKMIDALREQGVRTRIIYREVHDCLIEPADLNLSNELARKCVFVGSGYKSPFLAQWPNATELIAFTDKQENELSPNVQGGGAHAFNELVRRIPRDRFGILWDSDLKDGENYQNYTRYSAPHKMGLYLSLGMPVICWKESATAEIVQKYDLGFAVNSLEEIDGLLAGLTDEDLKALKDRVNRFSSALREGFFTRKALVEAEEKIFLGEM